MDQGELLKVAFVGVKRKYQDMPEGYRDAFTRFHLEIPWYYARGDMEVTVTTVDHSGYIDSLDTGGQFLFYVREDEFRKSDYKWDVVVHWRKWFPELYRPEAINVMMSQDHSFSKEWQDSARDAFLKKELYGIMCFPTWHKKNTLHECPWLTEDRVIEGLHFGVDTDIYAPSSDKNPYDMLWASDPGRGLDRAIRVAMQLHAMDRRFKLHVCYPDYCRRPDVPKHSALVDHGQVPNGVHLRRLFNCCGVMPYTSTFPEPSSRSHRQAMAAESLVLYPQNMGTPSFLIKHMETGVVSDCGEWPRTIIRLVSSGQWAVIGKAAREYAISESWAVQADRFVRYFEKAIEEKKNGN